MRHLKPAKSLLLCLTGMMASSLIASSAMAADTVGTVNLTGHVTSQCTVESGGSSGTATMTATFAAGELATDLGRLRTINEFSTNGLGVDNGGNFRVNCNNANATVKLQATPFANVDSTAQPATGYANTIAYTALADFKVVGGSANNVSLQVDSGAPAVSTPVGSGIYLQNAANNVILRANNFHTSGASDLLVPGNYSGTITVTLTPSA